MPENQPPEASERARIAQHLDANRDRIIASWLEAVQRDDRIPSADRLTMEALKDHFPEMLAELISAVHEGQAGEEAGEALETGREHGKARWRNGYRLDEVLRELNRIREMIVKEVVAFCEGGISGKVRDQAVQTMRFLFDSIVATSAQQFVKAQEAEVILRASQLQHAYELVQAATEERRAVAQSRLGLLRAVTHELRNTLQPITLAAELLLRKPDASDRETVAGRLSAIAGHLQTLLDRLGALSSLLAGDARVRLEKINLVDLLHSLAEMHRDNAERKGLRFESRVSIDVPEITSDREKLQEIGAILLSNAIKFTSTGFVRVEISGADDDRWILRVSDSGSGIDPKETRHIFREFHSQHTSSQTGVRLGLVISRHLAHLLGGEITFQSTVGEGSCFEVNLPRVTVTSD
jgi:signal transduction histidine kinase